MNCGFRVLGFGFLCYVFGCWVHGSECGMDHERGVEPKPGGVPVERIGHVLGAGPAGMHPGVGFRGWGRDCGVKVLGCGIGCWVLGVRVLGCGGLGIWVWDVVVCSWGLGFGVYMKALMAKRRY